MVFPALLLAGGAQALSLAWPWARPGGWWSVPGGFGQPLWWLQILSLAVLAGFLQAAQRPAQAFWRAWGFATAWLAGAFWWLFISMHVYGGLAALLAALAVLLLAGFLGSYAAGMAWIWARWCRPASAWRAALAFAAAWTLAELARGWLWTGFPWGAGGYAHVQGPLAVLPRWLGVYGTGAAAAWLAYWLAALWRGKSLGWSEKPAGESGRCGFGWTARRKPQPQWGCGEDLLSLAKAPKSADARGAGGFAGHPLHARHAGWLLALGLGWVLLWQVRERALDAPTASPALHVALLQGNIPQDEKFQPGAGVPLALDWYRRELLHAARTALPAGARGLVVTPETAIPLLPGRLERAWWQPLRDAYTQAAGAQAAWIGLPLNEAPGIYNAMIGWMPGDAAPPPGAPPWQAQWRYAKQHLVPFGEFIPPLFRWFVDLLEMPLGEFARGAGTQAPMRWAGERLAANICYEDLFGEELAALFVDAAQAPTILVNASNIAWFGHSVALDQHLAIGRMRALELERPMLRATNTGATAIIDPRGAVVQALPAQQRAVLRGTVRGSGHITPFACWASRFGLLPLWGLCLGGLLLGSGLPKRKPR